MSKGVGRGRGWLNLKQSQNNPNTAAVGNLASPPLSVVNQTNLNTNEENQFVDPPESGCDLANKIKQLNINDDGILFNQKIKYIVENWKNDCRSSEEVELVPLIKCINNLITYLLSGKVLISYTKYV